MQLRLKIIPDQGPTEVYEFASIEDMARMLLEREEKNQSFVHVGAEPRFKRLETDFDAEKRVGVEDPQAVAEGRHVPVEHESTEGRNVELSPTAKKRPGFIKSILGIK